MPSLRGTALRDISVSPAPQSLADRFRSRSLDPTIDSDKMQLAAVLQGIESGAYSDEAIEKFMQENPKVQAFVVPSLQKAAKRVDYSQYFNPGKPAVPFETTEEQEFGLPPLQGNLAQQAVPQKQDMTGAVLATLSAGDAEKANKIRDVFKTQAAESPFSKIDPKDYTPESLTKYSSTGNVSDLVPREKPQDVDARNDKTFTQEGKLRDEFRNLSKDFIQVRDSYGRIQESAKNPSAAGDLALLFNFMKMLDPGSTVREGEFANAQNSAGVPDQVRNLFNRALSGERIAFNRQDFVDRSKALYERQRMTHKKLEKQYGSLAKRYSVNPDRVVTDLQLEDMPGEAPGLKPGTVQDGYEYIGGDPAKPSSWKQIK